MSLKVELLDKLLDPEANIRAVCAEFGISRKTAYKWIKRYEESGVDGLSDRSRRPLTSPSRVSEEMTSLILRTRGNAHWGGRKLRQHLKNRGVEDLPSEATFNRILLRCGQIDAKESEKRERFIRFEREQPNELWQMDFKGHFKLHTTGRCHPLTILDDHSRFSICIKACEKENEKSVRQGLEQAFRVYGLPEAMTMDNGAPWRGSQRHLSRITVWLMRLGIKVSHSTPGHPQTQGKLERFHRSLKEEVLKYHQFSDLKNAQLRFDEWREVYNNARPHEGIGLLCPKDRYTPSSRVFPEKLPEIIYPDGLELKRVSECGGICLNSKHFYVGEHLAREYVALRELEDGVYDVYFCKTKVQRISLRKEKRTLPEVLPMS
ncbi:MAG: IS481 family transposase [Chlamydiales bacterium]